MENKPRNVFNSDNKSPYIMVITSSEETPDGKERTFNMELKKVPLEFKSRIVDQFGLNSQTLNMDNPLTEADLDKFIAEQWKNKK